MKIALLPNVVSPEGTETVVILKDGMAKRASLVAIVTAALASTSAAAIATINAAVTAAQTALNTAATSGANAITTALSAATATLDGKVAASAASAAVALSAADEVELIAASVPPLASLLDTSARHLDGIRSPTLGSGNGAYDTGAGVTFLMSEKRDVPGSGTVRLDVKSVGTGTFHFVRATGNSPGPYTFVASVAKVAGGTGDQSWSSIDREAGEHLLVSIPAGGPSFHLLSNSGQSGYLNTGNAFTAGTKTLAATANKVISGGVSWNERGAPALTLADFALEEQKIFAALTDKLVDADKVYGRTGPLYSASSVPPGHKVVIAIGDDVDTIHTVQAHFSAAGTAWLVHARGSPGMPNGGYNMSLQPLTVSGAGEVSFEAPGDFTAINFESGDTLDLWMPLTGGATLSRDFTATGKTYRYTDIADAVPIPGNPETGPVGGGYGEIANCEAMARAIGTKKVLDLTATVADPPSQFLFVTIISQSQWAARGVTGTSPAIPAGVAYEYDGTTLNAVTGDPIGTGTGYSPVPALVNSIYESSGGRVGVIILNLSVLGSSVLQASNPTTNWSSTGTLLADAITKRNAARAAMQAAGMVWKDGPIIFDIGYTDADQLALGTAGVTKANYKAGVLDLITALEAGSGYAAGQMSVVMSRTGWTSPSGAPVTAAYGQIQDAQDELDRTYPFIHMGYRGAYTWGARNILEDYIHAGTVARDEMGTDCGITVYRVGA